MLRHGVLTKKTTDAKPGLRNWPTPLDPDQSDAYVVGDGDRKQTLSGPHSHSACSQLSTLHPAGGFSCKRLGILSHSWKNELTVPRGLGP